MTSTTTELQVVKEQRTPRIVVDAPTIAKSERSSLIRIGVIGAILAVLVRVYLWRFASIRIVDGDESVVGIMARHMIDKHSFPAFFLHQFYGGTLEPAMSALAMLVLGKNDFALKLGTLVFATASYVVTYFVAAEWTSKKTAITAAAVTAVSNGFFVWWSTKARGFYWAVLFFGMLILLLSERINKNPKSPRLWLAMGFFIGVGWWQSPQILFFVVPSAIYLAPKVWASRRQVMLAVPAFLVGSFPWIVANITNSWGSLQPPPGQPHTLQVVRLTFGAFFTQGISFVVGTQHSPKNLSFLRVPVAAVFVIYAVYQSFRLRSKSVLPLIFMATFPFVYCLIVSEGTGGGRYVEFLFPVFCILLVSQITREVLAITVIFSLALLSIAQLNYFKTYNYDGVAATHAPNSTKMVQDYLLQHRSPHFYASYAVAHRIVLNTNERLIGVPYDTNSTRYQPYNSLVQNDPNSAYVFIKGDNDINNFFQAHSNVERCFTKADLGEYLVYTPHPNCR